VKEEEEEEEGEKVSETFERSATPRKPDDRSHDRVQPITSTPRSKFVPTIESLDNVFETTEDSLATKIQNRLQTSEGREALQADLGPLGQKYIEAVLRGTRDKQKSDVDYVYGVYLHKDGLMFGNKRFDVDNADNIIIDDIRRYTWSLRVNFQENSRRSPLHGRRYEQVQEHATSDERAQTQASIVGAIIEQYKYRGYKYKYVIAPLMSITSKKQKNKSGKGLPHTMILNDNVIYYVHWDDPNELMNRLRLLDASHRAGNKAHDNEMLSIIEELREAGLIIN